ncbi:MAG: hypothetical protein HYW65_02145 [Candidatus Liptonbacteria bacterium]|nr:hypothetical protein [Candidatus Liptonbacteria bacterium]
MNRNIIYGAFFMVIAFLLQARFGGMGIGLENAVFIALLGLAFFLTPPQIVLFASSAAWLLNWQPAWSAEVVLLAAIPVAVSITRDLFPGSCAAGFMVAVVLGAGLWYAAADIRFVGEAAPRILREAALSGAWALAILACIRLSLVKWGSYR